VWNNILYDVAKYDIRPDAALELDKLVELMKKRLDIRIELSAHTDCRGKDKYNMDLSEKRALSAVDYLVCQGIDWNRLVAKGYGETKPVNSCNCDVKNGENFSDEEHQANRRTEIKVLDEVETMTRP